MSNCRFSVFTATPATTNGPITHPRPASSTPAINISGFILNSEWVSVLDYNAFPKIKFRSKKNYREDN